MTRFDVLVREAARRDVARAAAWYEDQAELGEAFLTDFEQVLLLLEQLPTRLRVVEQPEVRRAPFRRFPYVAYLRVSEADATVRVLAVLHARSGHEKIRASLGDG